jgi:hypothetical protein
MRTDGQADMKLTVAFRNFANTPNKEIVCGLCCVYKIRSNTAKN